MFSSQFMLGSIFCQKYPAGRRFIYIFGDFSWEGGGTLPQNSYKPSPGPMRSYSVEEKYISSAVSEILLYRQKDILLPCYKDDYTNK